jgi:hypothetical protein
MTGTLGVRLEEEEVRRWRRSSVYGDIQVFDI